MTGLGTLAAGLALLSAAACVGLVGCSSVTLPEQHLYRLRLPEPPPGGVAVQGGVLRVGEVRLAADLEGDQLLVADGAVRVVPYEHHRWAGPLDHMIGDAFVSGLARTQAFRQVKSPGERGGEDWMLTGRVLDFHQTARGGAWVAQAHVALRLVDAEGCALFDEEFRRHVPLGGDGPEHLALALSAALAAIVTDVTRRCGEVGVFETRFDSRPGR